MSKKTKNSTRVVCLKMKGGEIIQGEEAIYIGRKMTQGGWNLENSIYANPFKGQNPVYAYYKWIMEPEQEKLRKKAKKELKGQELGCWCKNEKGEGQCHGDVLVYVVDDIITPDLEAAIEEEEELIAMVNRNSQNWIDYALNFDNPGGETIMKGSYKDRIYGMFCGLFLGDAKGSLYEFGTPESDFEPRITERLAVGNRYNKEDIVEYGLGQVTDDSEMAIILASHLTGFSIGEVLEKAKKSKKKEITTINAEHLAEDYMEWAASGQSSMGKNTRQLFGNVKTLKGYSGHFEKKFGFVPPLNDEPEYESEEGENQLSNGSLMRCCSLALLPDNSLIYRDVYLTNPSSKVMEMESDYLEGLRMAIRGELAEDILKFFFRKNKNRCEEYQSVLDDLKNGEKRTLKNKKTKGEFVEGKGSIMSSMYATLWCLMWFVNGEKPVLSTSGKDKKDVKVKINVSNKKAKKIGIFDMYKSLIEDFPGSDTDTNCAIAGALMGALLGYHKMSENEDFVYDMNLIFDIEMETHRPRQYDYHPAYMYQLLPLLFMMYEEYHPEIFEEEEEEEEKE